MPPELLSLARCAGAGARRLFKCLSRVAVSSSVEKFKSAAGVYDASELFGDSASSSRYPGDAVHGKNFFVVATASHVVALESMWP